MRSEEELVDSEDRAWMKIEFYNHWGDYFGGPAMLGVDGAGDCRCGDAD